MEKEINIVYISFSGNVRSFARRLQDYAAQQHQLLADRPTVKLLEISEATIPEKATAPSFVILPTYMTGGSEFTPEMTEMLTTPMRDYLESYHNIDKCQGFIGSGNITLGKMYVITAKTYAKDYGRPLIAAFESRGTIRDIEKIYKKLSVEAFGD